MSRTEESRPTPPLTEEAVQGWLVQRIAAHMKVDPAAIDVAEPFSNFGLDSRTAVALSGELEEWVARPLPATLVWDYPTIELVARHVTAVASRHGIAQMP